MSIIKIIPISDESANKSKFVFANYNVETGKVIFKHKATRGKVYRDEICMCSFDEFVSGLDKKDRCAKQYLKVFMEKEKKFMKEVKHGLHF